MKIAIASPANLGKFSVKLDTPGDFYYPQASILASELNDIGHEVYLFVFYEGKEAKRIIVKEDLVIILIPKRRFLYRYLSLYRQEYSLMAQKIVEIAPDIVHCNWTYEYALAGIRSGLPSIVVVRDIASKILLSSLKGFEISKSGIIELVINVQKVIMQRYVLSKVDKLVSISPYVYGELLRLKRDSDIITNGFVGCEAKCRYSSVPKIISINNEFTFRKNVHTLLEGFSLLRKEISHAELILVGHQYEIGGKAHSWARQRGLDDGVRFLGSMNYTDMQNLMLKCQLLVHPSREETFGNTLVESMGISLPIVAGMHSGAVPWVLGGGDAGKLININSPLEIYNACREILISESEWEVYSKKSGDGFERFKIENIAREYENLYISSAGDLIEQ